MKRASKNCSGEFFQNSAVPHFGRTFVFGSSSGDAAGRDDWRGLAIATSGRAGDPLGRCWWALATLGTPFPPL